MAARRTLLWLLVLALVCAQALGFVHRVSHGDRVRPASAAALGHAGELAQHRAQGWLESLFPAHDDAQSCRLYDQLGQGAVLPTLPALALPPVSPSPFILWFQGELLARWAALFDARGPPPVR